MWRPQLEHFAERGIPVTAVELPGHGRPDVRALHAGGSVPVDRRGRAGGGGGCTRAAGRPFARRSPLDSVHGLEEAPPVAGFVAASCTAIPRGVGLHTYRALARAVDALPNHGMWVTDHIVDRQLSEVARADFSGGGYAFAAQDVALASLEALDLRAALPASAFRCGSSTGSSISCASTSISSASSHRGRARRDPARGTSGALDPPRALLRRARPRPRRRRLSAAGEARSR